MGALAHVFEAAGLPTTQISLIRPHTERMRPPRALWVPFILGRPLGQPGDPDFQKRVLRSALRLFDAKTGPVLVDHPEDAVGAVDLTGMSCPVSWAPLEHDGALVDRLRDEIAGLRTWYDLSLETSGRTAFGASGADIDSVAGAIAALADAEMIDTTDGRPIGEQARLLAEDLKAFITEAAAAQPGDMSPFAIKAWFWEHTVAAEALLAAHGARHEHPDPDYRRLASTMIPAEFR